MEKVKEKVKVKVVNSSMVPPAFSTPSSSIWLSNLDLFAAPTHVRTVFFFRNSIVENSTLPPPAAIKSSLTRVLVSYYPFAGRFGRSEDGRREIKCTGEGAFFAEAVSELTLDEFGVYTPSTENCRLLVPTVGFNTLEKNDENIPILLAQLTTFKCGGLCLGIAMHHQLTDGIGALRFFSDWAAVTRDPTIPIEPPCFDRSFLRARSPPSVKFRHPEFDLRERPAETMAVSFNYLNLTEAQIAALKASYGEGYTAYESIAAHIWRCTCMARGPARPEEEIRLLMTVDVRSRLRSPIPKKFVGDGIMTTVAIAPAAEVASASHVAYIRAAIAKLDDEYLRSALDYLELQEDKGRLARSAGNFALTDISVTSWTKLPFCEVDFGWGPPEFMGPAAFFYSRQIGVLPNPGGGIQVGCSLETEYMESFVKLFHGLLPTTENGHVSGT